MQANESFDDLRVRLQSGEDEAASEVFQRFATPLIAKARSRLNPAIRKKIDPEDVVQSVYRTFFRRLGEGQFELENWESLWGLLLTITVRKCGRNVRHFHTDQRDVTREQPVGAEDSQSPMNWEAIAREPTPEDEAILAETIESLMQDLQHDAHRDILTLSLQGYSQAEIADHVDCSQRTVRRVLMFVKDDLEKMQHAAD